jgi:hypothetical protein
VAAITLDDAVDNAVPSTDEDADRSPRFAWERRLGIAVVVACVLLIFGISDYGLHLWPLWHPHFGALFTNTTTNGGDMGAHVWWPWFMEHHWFGQFRLAGWAPDWYAGFPVGQFYFPLPALLIAFLNLFIPYNVAFKLVTVSGPLLLPVAAYAFARGLRAHWPSPPAFAIAATVFLFNTRANWQIYGGNLASNLAGEFSYTLAISLSLFFLASFAKTLDTGKRPWLPALLFALSALSHIVVITFSLAGALFVWLSRRPWRTVPLAVPVLAVGGLLTSVWAVPLFLRQPYTQSMRYEKVTAYWDNLKQPSWMWVLVACALIGAVVWRRRSTFVLAALAITFAVMFRFWPADQHVWNTRYLPLYLLSVALLCGAGGAEIAYLVKRLALRAESWVRDGDLADARDDAWASVGAVQPFPDEPPPDWEAPEHLVAGPEVKRRRAIVGALVCSAMIVGGSIWGIGGAYAARNYLPFWSQWNYTGYEAKPAWPEFSKLIQTMDQLPPGRAMWEPSGDIDKYGTTLALELLPYFTNGRIDSMEGLYFESSATTDYHFLTVSEVTADGKASNPVRGLDYGTIADFNLGVKHMQMMGVNYYMAQSADAKAKAHANPDLEEVATVPDLDGQPPSGWTIYEVKDSPLIEGLTREPVVAKVHSGTSSSCFGTPKPASHDAEFPNAWECATAPWWMNANLLDIPYTQSGPNNWPHIDMHNVTTSSGAVTSTLADAPDKSLPPVTITNVKTSVSKISFHVSQTGVPVLVKESYFPNWKVSGASGIYRAAPNFMVVVPTKSDVTLTYGLTGVDWLGRAGTLIGFVGLAGLIFWHPATKWRAQSDEGDGGEQASGDPNDDGDPADSDPQDRTEPAPALP